MLETRRQTGGVGDMRVQSKMSHAAELSEWFESHVMLYAITSGRYSMRWWSIKGRWQRS